MKPVNDNISVTICYEEEVPDDRVLAYWETMDSGNYDKDNVTYINNVLTLKD